MNKKETLKSIYSNTLNMKILAIGDFHGKITPKLWKRVKQEKYDLILTPGDFCGNDKLGKLFFKYAYGTDKSLSYYIGKKRVKQLERESYQNGINVIKKLKSLKAPIIGVRGNWDPTNIPEIGYPKKNELFSKQFAKQMNFVEFKRAKFGDYNIVGYFGGTYPGYPVSKTRMRKRYGPNAALMIKRMKKDNTLFFKRIKKLWRKNTILLLHNCPYNTKLDIIRKGPQKGKHYGSWLARKIITELKPVLAICGHMHENQGIQKLGKTIVVNTGAAKEGRAAILDGPRIRLLKYAL